MDESEDSIAGGKTAFLLIIKQNKQKQPRRGKTNWQEGQDRAGQGWAGLGWTRQDTRRTMNPHGTLKVHLFQ